jgi:hypothetical protein
MTASRGLQWGAVYPRSEMETAFADQASRKVRGKVILQP